MKLLRQLSVQGWLVFGGASLACWLLAGCGPLDEPAFTSSAPAGPIAATNTMTAATNEANVATEVLRFHIGDTVTVIYSDTPDPIQPHEERIREDGNITLPLIGTVKAVDKTPGELQKTIHDLYVPKYYVRLTVTVNYQSVQLVYFVDGEVKVPNRYPYLGPTTVLKAISSAGDFTDYARKNKVLLTRANGTIITVDCKKAQNNPALDLPVFPGDKIHVPRRIW
jgi:protein involved in polysaccharide export with SLBB domain